MARSKMVVAGIRVTSISDSKVGNKAKKSSNRGKY